MDRDQRFHPHQTFAEDLQEANTGNNGVPDTEFASLYDAFSEADSEVASQDVFTQD